MTAIPPLKRKSPRAGDTSIIWDNATVSVPALGLCINATPEEFEAVGAYLMSSIALKWPDPSNIDDRLREITDFDEFLRNAAHRIAIQMMAMLSVCGLVTGMRLRQKEGNPCIWQQEQAENVWVDIFDMSLCMSEIVDEIDDRVQEIDTIRDLKDIYKQAPQDAEELLQKFEDLYEGTSESYNPQLVNDDLSKKAAICSALREVLNGYIIEAQRLKQQELDGNGIGVLAIGAAAAIVGLLGAALIFPPSAAAAAALYGSMVGAGTLGMAGALLGASGAALAIFTEAVKQTSMPILQDNAAKEVILCAWYDVLKGDTDISHEDFKQALTVEGGNAPALYAVIDSLRQVDLAYPAFLERWASHITLGQAGAIYDECGCEDPGYEMVTMPGYTAIIDHLGMSGEGDVYEITLNSSELHGHVTWIRVITDVSNRNFKIKNIQRISNIKEFKMDTPGGYVVIPGQADPDAVTQAFIFEATADPVTAETNYPAKIRITIEVQPV